MSILPVPLTVWFIISCSAKIGESVLAMSRKRTGNNEQVDQDQGKSEGGEECALSCSAEDPGGEGEIWSE